MRSLLTPVDTRFGSGGRRRRSVGRRRIRRCGRWRRCSSSRLAGLDLPVFRQEAQQVGSGQPGVGELSGPVREKPQYNRPRLFLIGTSWFARDQCHETCPGYSQGTLQIFVAIVEGRSFICRFVFEVKKGTIAFLGGHPHSQ